MGRRYEIEAGPSHRSVSSPPITTTRTQIGTQSTDGEYLNTERAETVEVGEANSVPNVSENVVASQTSKKGGNCKEAKISFLFEPRIAGFGRSGISKKIKKANGGDKIRRSHD